MKAFLTRVLAFVFPCVAIAQIATLQIRVVEGENTAHAAGAHSSRPITVQVTDDTGQPVAGAAVSFQLPAEGPSGVFSNGLRTDLGITDSAGRVSVQSIQLNRISGQFRIRITAVKELNRDLGQGLHAVVQARGDIITGQSILASEPVAAPPLPPVVSPTPGPNASPAAPAPGGPSAERSVDVTPTAPKMAPHSSKKWIVVAAVVAACAGAAAAVAVSRATGTKSAGAPPSTITIGTPTITIGNPNP